MAWELHLGPRVFRVGARGLVIGRAAEVDVPISDPLVSRQHALVRPVGTALEIEDMRSRQGVRVNGVAITGRVILKHGDRIAICSHELAVIDSPRAGRERATTQQQPSQPVPAPRGDATRRIAPAGATGQASPAEVLVGGVEDALARGDEKGCEFALTRLFDVMVGIERAGGADATFLRRYAICALRAAKAHARADWVDAVVDVHAVRPRVMHAATADSLEGALSSLGTYDRARLKGYVAAISGLPGLGVYEQFCLERLRTLAG